MSDAEDYSRLAFFADAIVSAAIWAPEKISALTDFFLETDENTVPTSPKVDDFLEYEDDFKALRCAECLKAERKWRERDKILVQCTLCKGEWENSSFCSCCGNRFFPTSYLPVSGPVLVPCPDCTRPGRIPPGQSCTLCGRDSYPPGWVLLVKPTSEST